MNTSTRPDVLICGAGPTGLVLALRLARSGVRIRIVDAAAEPGTTSRAIVVHARTLEFYRQMGLIDAFMAECQEFNCMNLWVRGRRRARVEFTGLGADISYFPFMCVMTQDRHERFLIEHLRRAGIEVERSTTLTDATQTGDGVTATLRGPDGTSVSCEAAYLAGCDGARSRVREVIRAGFPGGTYEHVFYVADVEASGPVINGELHLALDDADLLGIFPLRGGRTARMIGTVRPGTKRIDEVIDWDSVGKAPLGKLGVTIERINWFSTYNVHHRMAEKFREGRVFLLGDAGHIHSPAGGQGMNTGIGDAMNLAWKLAGVVRGGAPPALLDTYAPERMAFARQLVATTDRVFMLATSDGAVARFVRTRVVPFAMPRATKFASVKKFMFRLVSQTSIAYRESRLSAGRLGRVHGGDRLPWVRFQNTDNFAGVDDRAWQVHVYGVPQSALQEACSSIGIPLHAMPWQPAMANAGLTQDGIYALRPDGHVAWAGTVENVGAMRQHLREFLRAG